MTAAESRPRPSRVLVLGSGALKIGEAGEFDYSGSQAIKALKEEGVYTVVVNPNIATHQTSDGVADAVYLVPVDPEFIEPILIEERIDSVLLGFGGQTALNAGLRLAAQGVFERLGIRILATPIEAIRATEDRQLFIDRTAEIGVKTARSRACTTIDGALEAARTIGYPVILRGAFSLGGKGSSIVHDEGTCRNAIERALTGVPQVLVEECLLGWKELEYEVVRDASDNCLIVCNMENVDPMGIHTGESIVVAPSQTLNDEEHQMLRDIAFKTIRHLGIIGECNIQFALDPKRSDYRVIEVNARLSRSSALASKATGYPLAYIAAKIALGYTLPQLKNPITGSTSAFFEPALDYIVCKVPRWDLEKFVGVDRRIGTEMKSIGEVMAIGRCFAEVIQKALRMIEVGVDGLDPHAFTFADLSEELKSPSPRRIFAVARAIEDGISIDEIHRLTSIDHFFLKEIERIVKIRRSLRDRSLETVSAKELLALKQDGFSDRAIASTLSRSEAEVRGLRDRFDIHPRFAQIDTMAAEYPAQTNYLYLTYHSRKSDTVPASRPKILVLGSGCYRIGSSVEFDWCCVNAAQEAVRLGYEVLVLNCNPETVSTDYDMCDRLIFDEITLETVLEIYAQERPQGVVVSMGGQTPNNLALTLARNGVHILGTAPESIDCAEDRKKFSALLDELKIEQPRWAEANELGQLDAIVDKLGGYPVLIRPSYVLSGAAMRVAHTRPELQHYLAQAALVSLEHPVVVSKFERHAREIEFDAVAEKGRVTHWAISEHVEDAGVHSGDATLMIPPQKLYLETIRQVRRIAARLAQALGVSGPFNLQLLARHNEVMVIECNLRASRSFPFVSKALGVNFIREATRVILGAPPEGNSQVVNPLDLEYVVVKAAQFSFGRLSGADPTLGVEMASTGEVGCFGDDRDEALLKALMATGFKLPTRGVLLSLGPVGDKYRFTEEAHALLRQGLPLYATPGTAEILAAEGIAHTKLGKEGETEGTAPSAIQQLRAGVIDLVINIPREYDDRGRPDGFRIRRCAIDLEIPLISDLQLARAIVRALTTHTRASLKSKAWHRYFDPRPTANRRR